MVKIAVEVERALSRRAASGSPGKATPRLLAKGHGWAVHDIVCTSGPQDRSFEERHLGYSIAIVVAGSFQYSAATGRVLMSPGSLLLGNPDQYFECGHEHASGDRCISFQYAPEYFERLAAGAGGRSLNFRIPRLAPVAALSTLVARSSCALCTGNRADLAWEELGIELAARTMQMAGGTSTRLTDPTPSALARITRVVRIIEQSSSASHTLAELARYAGLSPFHFLRAFEGLTGLTPHQYVRRTRLREASVRLAERDGTKILDVALDCGFGDVSNFNRAFRREFGMSPRVYRLPGGR